MHFFKFHILKNLKMVLLNIENLFTNVFIKESIDIKIYKFPGCRILNTQPITNFILSHHLPDSYWSQAVSAAWR